MMLYVKKTMVTTPWEPCACESELEDVPKQELLQSSRSPSPCTSQMPMLAFLLQRRLTSYPERPPGACVLQGSPETPPHTGKGQVLPKMSQLQCLIIFSVKIIDRYGKSQNFRSLHHYNCFYFLKPIFSTIGTCKGYNPALKTLRCPR